MSKTVRVWDRVLKQWVIVSIEKTRFNGLYYVIKT